MNNEEKTIVVFRVFKDGEVLALFPTVEDSKGLCSSYQKFGQHSGADYGHCISITRPAKPEEYAGLLRELESIGYKFEVKKRYNPKFR